MTSDRLRIAVVGLGKMGISHFAILNAHPDVEVIACDGSLLLTDVLEKNVNMPVWRDYDRMLAQERLDAVVVATPSRLHAPMVRAALERGLSVFCEKPFCLDWQDSEALARLAADKGVVNQVGYHYRHVGAFQEMKRVVDSGALGRVTHVVAEAYGPVVLRTKRATWRTDKAEGGGCLYDYAAHPLNLLNWLFGVPDQVSGSHLGRVFSEATDDEVVSTLRWNDGPTALVSVNWSDESHRKMSTKLSLIGTNGRINADRQEIQVYIREYTNYIPDYNQGWTVKYTTDLTKEVWYYLRGEEYSSQLAQFVSRIRRRQDLQPDNDFASAAATDRTMAMILDNAETGETVGMARARAVGAPPRRRGLFGRR